MASARNLISKFTDLKTLPTVAIKVTQLANSDSTTIQDFEEVIKHDPVLVMRLLRLVNSPFFGLSGKVESLSKALVFVGIKQLRNLVAVEAAREFFTDNGNGGFPRKNLWFHSTTVAVLAQMISRRIFRQQADDVFLAAILHDIGLIIEDQIVPEDFSNACNAYNAGEEYPLLASEKVMIGTNHTEIGWLLAKEWHLSDDVVEAIRHHHDYETNYSIPCVTSILQLAEFMACRLKFHVVFRKIEPLPPYLASHLKSNIAEYRVLLKALPEEMRKAEELFEGE